MAQKLRRLYEILWLTAPVVVWFSYYPNIHFGQDETMNYELSLPLLLLGLLALASVPRIMAGWRDIVKHRFVWLVAALSVYSVATLFWSVNPTRSLLTSGIIGLLYLVFLGAVAERKRIAKLLPRLAKIYIVSALVMSGLALVQFVLGVWVAQDAALLCNGCVPQQFGFPRANVFAIEPQFFGNMLLPALLILAHRLFAGRARCMEYLGLGLMLLALFLTMSRGAIFALVVGLIILVILHIRQVANIAKFAGLSLMSLAVALSMQGLAAMYSPHVSETFVGAVGKSINQLTMGLVEIRPPVEDVDRPDNSAKEEPAFDGYVEESTDIRVGRTELALGTWQRDPLTMLFGVGLGGSGMAVHETFPDQTGAREIVQNEYIERLLERGAIGLALSVAALGALVVGLRKHKWLLAIIAAFAFQLAFFSGYPNALHIYLALILLVAVSDRHKVDY